MGQVLTLVVVADESEHYDALKASLESAREHPSRILVVIPRGGRGAPRLDAELRIGVGGPGDTILLRLHGELADHTYSVVLPLLLPDTPVVVWWPGKAPSVPAEDPLGKLSQRRLTDLASEARPIPAATRRKEGYRPGDTDLAWTRLTAWRALLAAALDQYQNPVRSAEVAAEPGTPSSLLLAAWLAARLRVDVTQVASDGPGLTRVTLDTRDGPIEINRPDGHTAELVVPGSPPRTVQLQQRETASLLAEELRRLDPDDIYAEALAAIGSRRLQPARKAGAPKTSTRTSTTKRASMRVSKKSATKPSSPSKGAKG
jgi:glucose-6-phosphate dehydrogenase assembly protein OpcA